MPKLNKTPTVYPIASSKTWGCKVKLPDGQRLAVSLRVPHPGNVGEAKDRANELQREVDARRLAESLKWLGEKSGETLKMRLGLKAIARDDEIHQIIGEPTTWFEARSAWLSTYQEHKTVEGKINDVDVTRKGYEARTRLFCRWADEIGLAFKAKSATTAALLFLRARRKGGSAASKNGVSKGSMDHDIRVLHTWFGWMQRKGWYDQLDKDTLYDDSVFGGDEDGGVNFIPDWKLDLDTLTKMHKSRFDDDASFSAWRLFVLVRGLGCRPKEACTLSWDTVQIKEGVITFRNTKEAKLKSKRRGASRRAIRDRVVPVVFQWVEDAIKEIQSLGGKRGTAVAVNTEGDFHRGAGQASNSMGRHLKTLGLKREGYNLKACQRAGLAQLETCLPPWVVARIAGHSLTIHMARYSTNDSHLPTHEDRNYGIFGTLSASGKIMVDNYKQPGLLKDMLAKGEL